MYSAKNINIFDLKIAFEYTKHLIKEREAFK